MLSLSSEEMCVTGNFDNKEGPLSFMRRLWGGGNAKVESENTNETEETTKNEVTQESTSTVAEDPPVSNLQTREEEVKKREDRVQLEEASLQERMGEFKRIQSRMFKENNDMYRESEERNEKLYKREREQGARSFDSLIVFRYFYKDTITKILIRMNHERCTFPKFLTDWFVYNWDSCGSVWQKTYDLQLSEELGLKTRIGDPDSDSFHVHVRPGSQRVVIFYLQSKLDAYMKNKKISYERALYELHKNMPYDDAYPDIDEDNDVWEVDDSKVQVDVLPGQIPEL